MRAKQPNTTEIRAPAQHKTVHSAEPKHHLWNPLRRRKEPQHIDRSSTETKHRSKTWRNLAWGGWVEAWALETFSNPPTDLAVGVGVNGRFHASLAPPPQARQRGRRILLIHLHTGNQSHIMFSTQTFPFFFFPDVRGYSWLGWFSWFVGMLSIQEPSVAAARRSCF